MAKGDWLLLKLELLSGVNKVGSSGQNCLVGQAVGVEGGVGVVEVGEI